MGLFSKKVAEAKIDFYSDIEVSVDYTCFSPADKDEESGRLIFLVAFYYAKMLYNLQNDPGADALIDYIQNIHTDWLEFFKKTPNAEYNPTLKQYYAYLVDKREAKPVKSFKAVLDESGRGLHTIKTDIPLLEPNRYIPPSVVALIQYAFKNLSSEMKAFLVLTLGGMNHYYQEQGNHKSLNQIMKAPYFGIQGASQVVAGLNQQQ